MFLKPRTLLLLSILSIQILGQSDFESYSDRAAFTSAAENVAVLDFEGIAANSGFVLFKKEGQFSTGGVVFRPGGGARFGPGHVTIVGAWYQAGPIYETTSGAKLIWSPPNQPGNAYIDILLPEGTTAVGTDFWAAQPYVSPVEVTATTSDGRTRTITVTTPQRPASAFVGFTASTPITSLRITPAKGQTGLIIDNFSFGRRNRAEPPAGTRPSEISTEPAATERPGAAESKPAAPPSRPRVPQRTDAERTSGTLTSAGTIAYVRGGTEIRLIRPDGTDDRRLWTHPDLTEPLGLYELAWRPDGKELAFSSGHAASASLYHSDIYTIRSDGTGLRKITNAPDRSEYSRYPKGTVTVTVRNGQAAGSTPGVFIVYVAGAPEAQQVFVPAGGAKSVVFKSVADFGKDVQPVVAVFGRYRWFNPGTDVVAGRNVAAPPLLISGDGIELFGAFRPVWRSDGSRISYRPGLCIVSELPANPTPGVHYFKPLFGGESPSGACTWDWGPTPETANQVIYTENSSGSSDIYRITEGGAHPGTKLVTFSDLQYQLLSDLQWLPDASGMVYSNVNTMRDSANIYRYDFKTKRVTQLTDFKNEFAREFSVSPDGKAIVFERCTTYEEDKGCDLWLVGTYGRGMRLLVKNGLKPAWGR